MAQLDRDAAHQHEWRSLPTLDFNPEQHFRECELCGRSETREGVTYLGDGGTLPATEWRLCDE